MNQFNQTKKQALDLAQQINQKILEQKKELVKEQKKIIQQKLKQKKRRMERLRKGLN